MSEPQPTTKAGRVFALALSREEGEFQWGDDATIARIEAEARAALLEELREKVEALPTDQAALDKHGWLYAVLGLLDAS